MSVTFSRDNIELAWHRSLRGENADYRALCSLEIDAFAWADKAHILQIQKELRQGTYSPCEVTRLYQPKPTGLLRPITILRVPDVVVYQTIANVIAEKAQKKFRK